MKNTVKIIFTAIVLTLIVLTVALPVFATAELDAPAADTATTEASAEAVVVEDPEASIVGKKSISAAIVVGVAATAGALGMAWAICKSVDGIARQPEAEGKIRTTLMLGLVFVETAIIYALVIGILIIFVL